MTDFYAEASRDVAEREYEMLTAEARLLVDSIAAAYGFGQEIFEKPDNVKQKEFFDLLSLGKRLNEIRQENAAEERANGVQAALEALANEPGPNPEDFVPSHFRESTTGKVPREPLTFWSAPQGWPLEAAPAQSKVEAGSKFDAGKCRMELLPPEFLIGTANVLTFGAAKYGDRNWEKGMSWSRPFGAMMRHMWAWWGGKTATKESFLMGELDIETGMSHLWHASCCLAFLVAYEARATGTDDRG